MWVVLLVIYSLLCSVHSSTSGLSHYTFPEDFIFGVSTAAYQIEGAWNEGGKGESMWDTYIHNHPDFVVDRNNADIAANSYHKWMDDVAMIQFLGVKYYRMSISWPRLLPKGTDDYISKDGVRYYRKLFQRLQKANITVLVTLFHWDLPTPLMDLGGWANPRMADYFEDYARVAFTLFGDIVKMWGTINEPHQHCSGYGADYAVPALKSSGIGDYLCIHYILLAHARAYRLYDKEFRPHQHGKIAITLDSFWMLPKDPNNIEDAEAAEQYLQMHFGIFAHPIYSRSGDYPDSVRERVNNISLHQGFRRSRLPYFTLEEIDLLRGSSDFFGLNHYTTFLASPTSMMDSWAVPSIDHDTGVKLDQDENWVKPGTWWFSVYPPGFRKLFNWITKNYGQEIPIIVTENGCSDHGGIEDYVRVSYYNEYLNQLLLAKYEDGCNIQGYFAWSLMDVFEWKDGYNSKFGIYHVDYNSPHRTRIPKLSALNFKEIVRTRQINFDYITGPENKTYLENNVKHMKLSKPFRIY